MTTNAQLTLSARPYGGETEYLSLESQHLTAEFSTKDALKSDGSAKPTPATICITNTGDDTWRGVIRIALTTGGSTCNPRFFLPGFMYGTNRGDAPLLVDSKCPRLRPNREFPASPWWMVRSDRLSHPCAFVYDGGVLTGFAASPYFVRVNSLEKTQWMPFDTNPFAQYAGFGCSLTDRAVWYTLGYENAPWMFVDSHKYHDADPLGGNCFTLESDETVEVTLYTFSIKGEDERVLHNALKWTYNTFHQNPRVVATQKETVNDMATAIARDAWMPQNHSYTCFVFDHNGEYEYRILPSISWTNGLSAAVPMLMSAHRLDRKDIRAQALDCIDFIVDNSLNPANNLPFLVESDGVWSNRGWWYEKQNTPGHVAYLVGQSTYLILKAYEWEKKAGIEHDSWLRFARTVVNVTEKTRNSDGEYPYVLSDKTGAGVEYDSFSGAWLLAAAARLALVERTSVPPDDSVCNIDISALIASAAYYHDAYIRHQQCYAGPLDIDKNMDSEGILAYIRAVRCLHELTGEDRLLDWLRDALYYEYSFKFCYNSPIKVPPLSTIGWSSTGGSITSVVNPHIHPMSSSVLDEMAYYLSHRDDPYIRNRMEDTRAWSCQCHMIRDGEFGYGRKGWMSERYCHSEGLLTEHYPDGSPASTWFALMPWASGSILEGLTGDLWKE